MGDYQTRFVGCTLVVGLRHPLFSHFCPALTPPLPHPLLLWRSAMAARGVPAAWRLVGTRLAPRNPAPASTTAASVATATASVATAAASVATAAAAAATEASAVAAAAGAPSARALPRRWPRRPPAAATTIWAASPAQALHRRLSAAAAASPSDRPPRSSRPPMAGAPGGTPPGGAVATGDDTGAAGDDVAGTPDTATAGSAAGTSDVGAVAADAEAPPAPVGGGAIGGFFRGLMGGREAAAEDTAVAEAVAEGRDADAAAAAAGPTSAERAASHALVVQRRRRRREEEEEEGAEDQTIRGKIFSRFAGSAFMRSAFNAKDRIGQRMEESDGRVARAVRWVFAENEQAQVVGEIRELDPSFEVSAFLDMVERSMIPQVLDAYLAGDVGVLRGVCTDEAWRMLKASAVERAASGFVMDRSVLDVSDVELSSARFLGETPVLIITFTAQQVNCVYDSKGVVVEGAVDDIRAVYYAWALVQEEEDEEQDEGAGGDDSAGGGRREGGRPWKLMEMVIRGAHGTI